MKYRQIVEENKPHDVWDGEFEYELDVGDRKKALALSKVFRLLRKNAKELRKEAQEVIE
ncbi:MAG: hypothetical protein H0Z19_11250 [Archaeoglobus sp.]|uniref:hypothetical protein n=1 Tax=Archaeoglobus sp. TaxID=1872626 RepID=UPI001D62EE35|nr:hypothetical protein [Archaeoglobus sp.]MBO8181023.1 hypothetical protein [Archaeoglobus sp.]